MGMIVSVRSTVCARTAVRFAGARHAYRFVGNVKIRFGKIRMTEGF